MRVPASHIQSKIRINKASSLITDVMMKLSEEGIELSVLEWAMVFNEAQERILRHALKEELEETT